MATPSTPVNFNVQTANQQILVSWNLSAGATSYLVHRSADNVTYTLLATVTGTPLATSYLDTSPVLGTQYWYKVAASTVDGTSPYTTPQSAVPTPTGEMCLSQIRLAVQQRADRVNSNFVTMPEYNSFINRAMFELYDLLVTTFEDYYVAQPAYASLSGNSTVALPNGSNTFQTEAGADFIPRPFYKLLGVDLAINTASNAWVTVNKFNFVDRNNYLYPNSTSTIYGVYNMRYRTMGSNIQFIPTPASGQQIRLWYIPRLTELLQDTDTADIGISGWLEYVIVRAAKYVLDKEESDTQKLDQELLFLKARIEETADNRDAGIPDTISNTRQNNWTAGWGPYGGNGGAGW